jgi:hypothetical protein
MISYLLLFRIVILMVVGSSTYLLIIVPTFLTCLLDRLNGKFLMKSYQGRCTEVIVSNR